MNVRKLIVILGLMASAETHAAISFVEQSTDHAAESASLTPAEPTGTADGDLVVGFCNIDIEDGTWSDPADFTQVENTTDATNTNHTYLGYKIRGADAGSGYNFTYSGTAAESRCTLTTWSGVDSTPLDVTYVKGSHYEEVTDDPNNAAPAITTNTDGAWVVLLQVLWDGTLTAGAPANYTLRASNQAFERTHNIASREIATAGTETPGVWTHTGTNASDDPVQYTIALEPAVAGPTFSTGPTEAPATNGYTISGTITGENATVYAAALNPDETAPADCTALQALSGTAEIFASEAWTADTPDSFALTAAGSRPRNDVYVCAEGVSGATAVTAFTDQDRSPDTGQTITALTSVATTSPFAVQSDTTGDIDHDGEGVENRITGMTDTSFLQAGMRVDVSAGFACSPCVIEEVGADFIVLEEDAASTQTNVTVSVDVYYVPTVAAADVVEGDDDTQHGDAVTVAADGDISWTDTSGGLCTSWDYNIQDVSAAGDFDEGPPNWATGDDKLYALCDRPTLDLTDLTQSDGILVFDIDVAMSILLTDSSFDPQGLDRDFSVTGTLPNGTTLDSETGEWDGTPTVEDESGVTLKFYAWNDALLYATPDSLVAYVIDTWQYPDLVGSTEAEANSLVMSAAPWHINFFIDFTTACSDTVASGDIISQSPDAESEVDDPFEDELSAVVSTGVGCGVNRNKINLSRIRIGL